MYTIHVKSSSAEFKVSIDHPSPSEFSPTTLIGVGSIAKRYRKQLEVALNGKDNYLLSFFGYLHKNGNEKGEIELVSRGKYADVKKQVLSEFLRDNFEHLNLILPYITHPGITEPPIETPSESSPEASEDVSNEGTPYVSTIEDKSALSPQDLDRLKNIKINGGGHIPPQELLGILKSIEEKEREDRGTDKDITDVEFIPREA